MQDLQIKSYQLQKNLLRICYNIRDNIIERAKGFAINFHTNSTVSSLLHTCAQTMMTAGKYYTWQ